MPKTKLVNTLPGKKRVRFNVVMEYADHLRFKRQAKLRGLSLADTFRSCLTLLERDHEQAREVIKSATELASLPSGHPGEIWCRLPGKRVRGID